uniref:Thyroglobulin type-1 domain-containing protein n=1 Tax=Scleropages formosus TaxID=113540 RepID=A0A8C9TFB7_SCLFO
MSKKRREPDAPPTLGPPALPASASSHFSSFSDGLRGARCKASRAAVRTHTAGGPRRKEGHTHTGARAHTLHTLAQTERMYFEYQNRLNNLRVHPSDSAANKKAFKVAGFTVLACLLIAGQAISVYFVLNQRNKLGDLEQSFSKQLHHKPSGESTVSPSTLQLFLIILCSVPGPSSYEKVNVPINSMPMMMDDTIDQDDKKVWRLVVSITTCSLSVTTRCHGHRPQCDMDGNYLPMQCQNKYCWCVDENGIPIPGSKGVGVVQCAEAINNCF